MGTPGHPDRPSGSEVARFITRKLLLSVILLSVAIYMTWTHSSRITSEYNTYAPKLHLPNINERPSEESLQDPAAPELAKPTTHFEPHAPDSAEPPLEAHPHSHDNLLYVDLAKDFWAPWGKAIMRSRPPMEEIKPGRSANNIPVPENSARSPRAPPVNYIDISGNDMRKMRDGHRDFINMLGSYNPQEDINTLFHNRGVVTVGGGEFMGPAIVSIKMLRATGCDKPVEVFLKDWNEYEKDICEKYLPTLNARCLIIDDFIVENGDYRKIVQHYGLKIFALLFSSFRNVVLLDSDSIPLVDPNKLFDSQAYIETGFLSWPDFWAASESPKFYDIAGKPFPSSLAPTSSEAGQIVIDKQRHLKTLLLATYYNVWGPKHFYPLLSQGALGQGDKNTFESAAVVLNATYYRIPRPVEDVGRYTRGDQVGFKGSGMVQWMPEEDINVNSPNDITVVPKSTTPAFIHANTPKMNAGHLVDEGDLKGDDGKRLRLWDTKEEQLKMFGKDLEKEVFSVLKEVGCALDSVIKEWKDRKGVCDRITQHYDEVFGIA